ncbi:MAG: helix-turn-helix domain-containing protein [Deltaproteobacteria bacterium]|nr:helix-turn-helix domain-containing protein [Deltaproteobacteria bacterium]MBW2659308.1 helix-turn-helix domain-containing protein [Deltaproteobacteria bacterium]
MHIGTVIRKHRKDRNLTLKKVAERASVSEGFLSQVENDVNSPSVDTLMRICSAIGVDAGELLSRMSRQKSAVLIKKSEWDDIDLSHIGFVTRRFFPPDYRTVIDSSILVIEPGRSIPARKNIKKGQEVLCVLKGSIDLALRDETFHMVEGDAAHFWSKPESQKITNSSTERSFVLWVGTV